MRGEIDIIAIVAFGAILLMRLAEHRKQLFRKHMSLPWWLTLAGWAANVAGITFTAYPWWPWGYVGWPLVALGWLIHVYKARSRSS